MYGTPASYQVRYGDTLFSIARRYHLGCRQLINANHLKPPYALQAGQTLFLSAVSWVKKPAPPRTSAHSIHSSPSKMPRLGKNPDNSQWRWPLPGKVVEGFSPQRGKGITISGHQRERIIASAAGVVVYSGAGLSGPGRMIIIRHADSFLTAYDNAARNFVVEGQRVRAGQVIAEAGVVDGRFFGVYFEIRKSGKPLNPRLYLSRR